MVNRSMEPDSHKYIYKNTQPEDCRHTYRKTTNVSRSIGSSGIWIGSGAIDKSGTEVDQLSIQFPFYSLVYVAQGKGSYTDEQGNELPLTSGSLFQRRPGLLHSTMIDPGSNWLEYYFDCNTEYFQHLCEIGLLERDVAVYQLQHDGSIPAGFTRLREQLRQSPDQQLADTLLNFLSFIRELIRQGHLATATDDAEKMIEKACFDFHRLLDKRIDIRAYCADNGFGYESFRKKFKKKLGISPTRYIVQKRLDQACHLLRASNYSITEIADMLGYGSPFEFSNQFKNQFGVFPKHFRGDRKSSGKAPEKVP